MGKKYTDSVKLIDKNKFYEPAEALALVYKLCAVNIFLSHF